MTDLQFRPATPDDIATVVPLIYQRSQQLFDTLVKKPKDDPEAFLRHDYLRGDGMFGWRNQVVGVLAGEIVCSATMYPGRVYRDLQKALMKSAASYFNPLKLIGVVARARPYGDMFLEPRADGLFVANSGVVPARQGNVPFTAILDHATARARTQGLAAIELDIPLSHDGAAYERVGFAVTGEVPNHRSAGLEGFRRMARAVA